MPQILVIPSTKKHVNDPVYVYDGGGEWETRYGVSLTLNLTAPATVRLTVSSKQNATVTLVKDFGYVSYPAGNSVLSVGNVLGLVGVNLQFQDSQTFISVSEGFKSSYELNQAYATVYLNTSDAPGSRLYTMPDGKLGGSLGNGFADEAAVKAAPTANLALGTTAGDLAGNKYELTAGGWRLSMGERVYRPTEYTSQAIQIAIDTAYANGGGTVQLDAVEYTCTTTLIPKHLVSVVGVRGGPQYAPPGIMKDTVLRGSAGINGFEYNSSAIGVAPSNPTIHANELNCVGIKNIRFEGFDYAVRIGGPNNPGATHSRFENLYAHNCLIWGFWFENVGYSFFENLVTRSCLNGQWYGNSVGPGYNYGNNNYTRIFTEFCTSYKSRNIVFSARNNSAFNDLTVQEAQANTEGSKITVAATFTNGSADIVVPDGNVFVVDLPVSVTATVNGFNLGQVYFISSVVGNTIQLRDTIGYGSARVATGNAAGTLVTYGFPALEVVALDATSQMQPSSFMSLDLEAPCTAVMLFQGAKANVNCETVFNRQQVDCVTHCCCRSSEITLHSSKDISFDLDDNSVPNVSFFGGSVPDNLLGPVFAQKKPFGMWTSRKFSSAVINLGFSKDDTIPGSFQNARSGTGLDYTYPANSIGQRISWSASLALSLTGNHAGSIACLIASAATWTLPDLTGYADPASPYTWWGICFEIINASTNGSVLTLATSGGKLFNRVAGKTSYSIPAGASITVRAQRDSTTGFWAVIANNGAT